MRMQTHAYTAPVDIAAYIHLMSDPRAGDLTSGTSDPRAVDLTLGMAMHWALAMQLKKLALLQRYYLQLR